MDKCSVVMLSGHKPQVADAVIEAKLTMLLLQGKSLSLAGEITRMTEKAARTCPD